MKTLKIGSLLPPALAVVVGLTLSSPALADCGKKSKEKRMERMSGMKDMEMSDDRPMCCKMNMKMDHQKMKDDEGQTETEKGERDAPMESMGESEVRDPVCSMTVDPGTAEKTVYKGKTYYFCSQHDKEVFERAPQKYVKN